MKFAFLLVSVGFTFAFHLPINETLRKEEAMMNHSFSDINFVATQSSSKFYFNLTEGAGVGYKTTLDADFRKALRFAGETILVTVNATNKGVAVFLSDCTIKPIRFDPLVVFEEYSVDKRVLLEGCIYVYLIATDGPSEGDVSFKSTEHQKWIHAHIIFAVTFGFVMFILLVRQCANHILRAIYSYDAMPEETRGAQE